MNTETRYGRAAARACGLAFVLGAATLPVMAGTFDFVIQTTAADQNFSFYVSGASGLDVTWGDGTVDAPYTGTGARSRTFAAAGVYTNKVSGTATRIAFGGFTGATASRLRDITSKLADGVTGITSAQAMFQDANGITQFTQADWFDAASANVLAMDKMFRSSTFNQDISGWDVSKVATLVEMFYQDTAFNQPIGNWDVGKVTDMTAMFYSNGAFDQPIGNWNVTNVTTMDLMFYGSRRIATDNYNAMLIRWSARPLKSNVLFHAGTATYDLGRPATQRQGIIDTFNWTITDGGTTGNPYQEPPAPRTVIVIR